LKQFPVVCLPNTGILSEREVDLFRRYVEEGGTLLITGHSGQFDRLGKPLAASTLEGLIGAKVKGRMEGTDHWMRFRRQLFPVRAQCSLPTARKVKRHGEKRFTHRTWPLRQLVPSWPGELALPRPRPGDGL
jgi:hypothetical protein